MGMSKCYALMKCLLILLNVVFLLVGAAACAVSCWALVSAEGAARAGLALLAVWGGALALAAVLCVCGAARGSGSLLAAGFALLTVTALGEAGAAVWAARHGEQLRAALRDGLGAAVRGGHRDHQILDVLQRGLQCCGAEGPRDWQSSSWGGALDLSVSALPARYRVPVSCCRGPCAEPPLLLSGESDARVWGRGCTGPVLGALGEAGARAGLAAGVLAAAHGGALLLALALCLRAERAVRKA